MSAVVHPLEIRHQNDHGNSNRFIPFALAIAILIQLVGLFDHSLWTTDEPWVAEIAREMAASGDYIIPKLSDNPFLEKPPLFYAVTSTFYEIFGTENEGFGRLASAFFAIGTLLVVFFGTAALYTARTAAYSILILATIIRFFLSSHWLKIENALAFFITGALFSFILAYRNRLKFGFILFWFSIALAFLSKGMVGIAIPLIAISVFVLWQREFSLIRKAWVVPGILLILFTLAAWAWALYARGGTEFVYRFFLYENLGRFLKIRGLYNGSNFSPFYYYLPIVFTDSLPWSIIMIAALMTAHKPDERIRFLYSWFFGGLLILSIAATKRHLYLLPLFPAMAVICGEWMNRIIHGEYKRWEFIVLRVILIILVIFAFIIPAGYLKINGSAHTAVIGVLVSIGLFIAAILFLARSLPEKLLAGMAILFLTWTPLMFPQMDIMRTYKPFYQQAGRIIGTSKVIAYHINESSLSFCRFYGGFKAHLVPDKKLFSDMITTRSARYIILAPEKDTNKEVINLVKSQGTMVLAVRGNKWRDEMQLWRIP